MSPEDHRTILRVSSLVAAVLIVSIAAALGKTAIKVGGEKAWDKVLAVLALALAATMVGVAFAITNKTYRFV